MWYSKVIRSHINLYRKIVLIRDMSIRTEMENVLIDYAGFDCLNRIHEDEKTTSGTRLARSRPRTNA